MLSQGEEDMKKAAEHSLNAFDSDFTNIFRDHDREDNWRSFFHRKVPNFDEVEEQVARDEARDKFCVSPKLLAKI